MFSDSEHPRYSLASFFDGGPHPNKSEDPCPALHDADIITGIDTMQQHEFIVYGRNAFEEIAKAGDPRELVILRVEIDQEDLEKFVALVEAVKGCRW
jgi:hypothetical protein